MSTGRVRAVNPKFVKVVAAVVVGLSLGTLVPPDPVTLPGVGTVSGILVGSAGLGSGAILYLWLPRVVGTDCGCSGDCSCS